MVQENSMAIYSWHCSGPEEKTGKGTEPVALVWKAKASSGRDALESNAKASSGWKVRIRRVIFVNGRVASLFNVLPTTSALRLDSEEA